MVPHSNHIAGLQKGPQTAEKMHTGLHLCRLSGSNYNLRRLLDSFNRI